MSYLTTLDNPFNPATEFVKWYNFDMVHGYNTCGKLARLALTSEEFTDNENDEEYENAIKEMITTDPTNLYRRTTKKNWKKEDFGPEAVKREQKELEKPPVRG